MIMSDANDWTQTARTKSGWLNEVRIVYNNKSEDLKTPATELSKHFINSFSNLRHLEEPYLHRLSHSIQYTDHAEVRALLVEQVFLLSMLMCQWVELLRMQLTYLFTQNSKRLAPPKAHVHEPKSRVWPWRANATIIDSSTNDWE